MALKQVMIGQGTASLDEVPEPLVQPGALLVQVDHSCISTGTEFAGLKASAVPIWKKAIGQPEKVRKLLQLVVQRGLSSALAVVDTQRKRRQPTGYSAAGVVVEVGAGVNDIQVGDRVACAGSKHAYHAEIISVPRNLVVRIPDRVSLADGSSVALGAIALQGVRRAEPSLGETFVVMGLGVIGQITSQILRANGCQVIGVDPSQDRLSLAESHGMHYGLRPGVGEIEQVWRVTGGMGADAVIITAASLSADLISTAFQMCRKKGRVVLVGDINLNLRRSDIYEKELDFRISTSYGPGRYDDAYEQEGKDYPVGYVRWTENRNMQAYLGLIETGQVSVRALISSVCPLAKVSEAYSSLFSGGKAPLLILLSYDRTSREQSISTVVRTTASLPARAGQIQVALVGAGDFARSTHLPNMRSQRLFHLRAIVSTTGHNAVATARQFHADYATTDYQQVLSDRAVDAVIITTRHDTHARLALEALTAGKHVLVEKPLAVTPEEVMEIADFFAGAGAGRATPVLLTGFNRRFSPHIQSIKEIVDRRTNPMIINYRMNAGYLPPTHWVHTREGGGRNIGEACHIYDLFTCLTQSVVESVYAQPVSTGTGYYGPSDNFVATIRFVDGSVATLTYTALGSKHHPKEQMEVFVDGKVLSLNDYVDLSVAGMGKGRRTKTMEKGWREELLAFGQAISKGSELPIPLWQQVQAMNIAFAVEREIRR